MLNLFICSPESVTLMQTEREKGGGVLEYVNNICSYNYWLKIVRGFIPFPRSESEWNNVSGVGTCLLQDNSPAL